jgi:regulatory protein
MRSSRARAADSGPDTGLDEEADPESVARLIGLRLLERAPRTRAELAKAMARRGVPIDAAETVLDRFTEVGLVDDQAFAEAWVRSRHSGRGLAPRALAAELRARGVDQQVAADALAEIGPDDEQDAAVALVRRRLRTMSTLPREVQRRRLVGMLGRKGFGRSLALQVVSAEIGALETADSYGTYAG